MIFVSLDLAQDNAEAQRQAARRYIDGAGQETRAAAARNPLYNKLNVVPAE